MGGRYPEKADLPQRRKGRKAVLIKKRQCALYLESMVD
jgi:hypothetical protein